ncbi:MAG: Crp/Fnr family transcriptional regulator [Clostridia bacterium]|nr:Crp/Fnr family transcriptional regulator [Clostridia bacterium]
MREEYEKVYSEIFPFWKKITEEDKNYICDNSTAISYMKGSTVHDGNGCSGVIFLKKGCLRLYIMSDEGKEITLYRLHNGEMCMLSASCVIGAITFDVFVDAEEESECYIIPGPVYSYIAENNTDIKIFTLETAVSRFSDVMWAIQQMFFMSVDKRLAVFLLDEAARTGSDTISLTQDQIAKYMGSAREVVSRMLKYFSSEGLVEVSRKGVKIIDKTALRRLTV